MELAKLSPKGQITVPLSIRKQLNLQVGDKILFFEDGDRIFLTNAAYVGVRDLITADDNQNGQRREKQVI